ncbi:MAG: metallopeptidase TldD-related protein, partial [Pseudomonadota bacterium]|nr:metallopeptidase TldD-related protein [Pseudomonadota bacterium]
ANRANLSKSLYSKIIFCITLFLDGIFLKLLKRFIALFLSPISENGKIGRPVKGATLVGNGPDVLTRVSMVGDDLKLDQGVGTCGKEGQSVPVGVGQPTLRVEGLTVGGTSA